MQQFLNYQTKSTKTLKKNRQIIIYQKIKLLYVKRVKKTTYQKGEVSVNYVFNKILAFRTNL